MTDSDKQDILIDLDELLVNFVNAMAEAMRENYIQDADKARDAIDDELTKPTESEDSE